MEHLPENEIRRRIRDIQALYLNSRRVAREARREMHRLARILLRGSAQSEEDEHAQQYRAARAQEYQENLRREAQLLDEEILPRRRREFSPCPLELLPSSEPCRTPSPVPAPITPERIRCQEVGHDMLRPRVLFEESDSSWGMSHTERNHVASTTISDPSTESRSRAGSEMATTLSVTSESSRAPSVIDLVSDESEDDDKEDIEVISLASSLSKVQTNTTTL